jgi:hypothetical protein
VRRASCVSPVFPDPRERWSTSPGPIISIAPFARFLKFATTTTSTNSFHFRHPATAADSDEEEKLVEFMAEENIKDALSALAKCVGALHESEPAALKGASRLPRGSAAGGGGS